MTGEKVIDLDAIRARVRRWRAALGVEGAEGVERVFRDRADLLALLDEARSENNRLRQAMAYEARVVEAHYEGYKTFPKTRRSHAEEQVARMRCAAVGKWPYNGTRFFTQSHDALTSARFPAPSPTGEETT